MRRVTAHATHAGTRRRREAGAGMLVVIVAMLLVGALAGAVAVSTMTGVRGGGAASARAMSQRAIEDGVELYRLALESGIATEATNWVPPPAQLQSLLDARGTVMPLATLTGLTAEQRTALAGAPQFAVRMAADDRGRHRYWQLVRITGPGAGGGSSVTAWLRGWYGTASGQTSRMPVAARTSFTPGGFHQFQLLVDGPIHFDDGAQVTGPVHSNGSGVGAGSAVGPLPGARVSCSGEFARISTGSGSVDAALPASCRRVASSRRWTFGTVREAFEGIRIADASGGEGVMLANPAGVGQVRVRLLGATVDVGGAVRPIGEGLAILVAGDVVVSGTANGRVTIASDPPNDRAGRILVDGDVRAGGPAASIGLFTEGDVVVSVAPCVTTIEAAVVAARGGLTIDRGYRTQLAQLDAASCGSFSFRGSIAAAEGPVLRWTWPSGAAAGYASRSYAWNPRLVRNPPPWTPVVEGWQVRDWQETPPHCGVGGAWSAGCG